MKFLIIIIVIGGIMAILGGATVGTYNYFYNEEALEDQILTHLENIVQSKAERVVEFLDRKKYDAIFLAESEDIKKIFDEELSYNVSLMQEKIKGISKKAAEDIEEYFLNHPNMTLKDLKNDEIFQKLAVQDVGETGYTYVSEMGTGILQFHPDPEILGETYHIWKERFPFTWEYNDKIAQSDPCRDSFGFYNWEDIEGNVRKKFTYHSCIDVNTKDNHSLYVGASTYLDEYGGSIELAHNLNLELKYFKNIYGYWDLILIDPKGNIIWTAEGENDVGTNLKTGIYNSTGLAMLYRKVKGDLEVGMFGPIYYEPSREDAIFITSPIFDDNSSNKNLVGMVALQIDNKKIRDLIATEVEFAKFGEIYIVDKNKTYITPLKNWPYEHLRTINSERIDLCFEDYKKYVSQGEEIRKIDKSGVSENYVGEIVFGAHQFILQSEWCILIEANKKFLLKSIRSGNFPILIIVATLAALILLIIINNYFKIEKLRGKQK